MVSHIHNGIDLDDGRHDAEPRRDRAAAPGHRRRTRCSSAPPGRLSPVKGHADLLRAARMVLETIPTRAPVIAGGGPLAGELVAYAAMPRDRRQVPVPGARGRRPRPDRRHGRLRPAVAARGHPDGAARGDGARHAGGRDRRRRDAGSHSARREWPAGPSGDDRALAEACLELVADRRARALAANARRAVEEAFSHERSGRAARRRYRSIRVPGTAPRSTRLRFVPGPAARRPCTMRVLTRAVFARRSTRASRRVIGRGGRREMNRIGAIRAAEDGRCARRRAC